MPDISPRTTAPCACLDRQHPAGRAIRDLFTRIKQLEISAGGDWPGAELVDLLTAWLHGVGIDPDRGTTQLADAEEADEATGPAEDADRYWPTPTLRASWAADALTAHHPRGAEPAST